MNTQGIKQIAVKDRPFFHRLIYKDGKGVKLLHSEKYNLRGKPDLIFKNIITGRLVPMELKSGQIKDDLHNGDIMQLTAYFLIIEDTMGCRPKFGYLRYQNAMFKVKNNRKRRKALLHITSEMRKMLVTGEGKANPSFVNCRYCTAKDTVCKFTDS